jgi:enoyl-[acyl-carrier-protein] reductase (NADH)
MFKTVTKEIPINVQNNTMAQEQDMESVISIAISKRNKIERLIEELKKDCDAYNTMVEVIHQIAIVSKYPHYNDLTQSIIPNIELEPELKVTNQLDDFIMVDN